MEVHIDPEVSKHQEIIDAITSATTALSQRSPESPASQQHTELTEKEEHSHKDDGLGYEFIDEEQNKNEPTGNAEEALHMLFNEHNADREIFEDLHLSHSDTQKSPNVEENESKPSEVKLVSYDPDSKPPRLGRPRRNITNTLAPPESSSSKNYNEAVMSKFRLDSQPIEGPGSRGGKGGRKSPKGRITSASIRKRTTQSTLNFEPLGDSNKRAMCLSLNKTDKNDHGKIDKETDGSETKSPRLILKLNLKKQTPSTEDGDTLRGQKPDLLSTLVKKSSTTATGINTNKKAKHLQKASRTTVLNNKNKITRQLPGPLVGLYYDLYDENLVDKYFDAKHEKIALGYPVTKAPYANDIVFIISFLSKFKAIIPTDNIGPQNFEYGLSLPLLEDTSDYETANYVKRHQEKENDDYDLTFVSPEMQALFKKLLGLVLNRKKPVTSHMKAIQELKPQSVNFGLPKEWKILKPSDKNNQDNIDQGPPVDPSNPEILLNKLPENDNWLIIFNPFYTQEFEVHGLAGIENPLDRLVMLRTLVHWALANSEAVKKEITASVQLQDIPGDKDTYYAARAILNGFKDAHDTKIAAETKLAKRKSEDEIRYIDPTSDPMAHPFKLRLNEQIAGDCGFGIGRFYLCRMADDYNGGLASVKKMSSIWSGPAGLSGPLASTFKLYVQDVHQMLTESLAASGVEFNEDGEEVAPAITETDESEYWYEVASNSIELQEFIHFLDSRLSLKEKAESPIPMASIIFRPVSQLRDYLSAILPLTEKQEELLQTKRSTRKRPIDYSDRHAAAKYGDVFEGDEYLEANDNDDDNYMEVEGSPVDEDEDEEYLE